MFSLQSVVATFIIVASWVAVAHIVRWLQVDLEFNRPAFLVFLNTTGLTLLPLLYSLQHHIRTACQQRPRENGNYGSPRGALSSRQDRMLRACCFCFPADPESKTGPGRLLPLVLPLAAVWTVSTFLYFQALARPETDVSSVSAVNQINSSFVFLFSICILGEEITLLRSFGVLFATAGVVLVTQSRGEGGSSDIVGDFVMIACACCWAFYEVASTRFVGPVGLPTVNLLLGLFGIASALCFWPVLLILHYTDVEPFEWPDQEQAIWILVAVLLNVVMHLTFNLGLSKCGPPTLSAAALLIVPSALVSDYLLHSHPPDGFLIGGSAALCASFVLANWDSWSNRSLDNVDPRVLTSNKYDGGQYWNPSSELMFEDFAYESDANSALEADTSASDEDDSVLVG